MLLYLIIHRVNYYEFFNGPIFKFFIIYSGFNRSDATQLITQTVIGAGKMVQLTQLHPAQLRDHVASPGGTTISAISKLEKFGYRNSGIYKITIYLVYEAFTSSVDKCKQLSKK